MAGHSKWAGIKHKKAIVDARRGKLFTKLARAITVAAKDGGGDVDGNPALALAVQKAKDASMPKDNIERAIAKGTGEGADAEALEAVMYEGYGPGGVAVLVEALTDNRNRTGSEMRHIFSKNGGNLGEPGSVAYLFDKKGVVVVDGERYSEDDLMVAIDAGAEDIQMDADVYEVLCEPSDLAAVRAALAEAGVEVEEASGRPAAEDARPARRGRRDEGAAADRRARGPGRRRRGARELRRRRRDPGAGRGLSGYEARVRSSWNPAAVALVALMALGSVVMWIGVPLALVYVASKLADTPKPSMGPYLLIIVGLPIGMAIVGKGLGALNRAHIRLTGAAGRRVPAGLDAVDARRAPGRPPRRGPRQGDDRLGGGRRAGLRGLVLRLRRVVAAGRLTNFLLGMAARGPAGAPSAEFVAL